jgi:hypothetical protein
MGLGSLFGGKKKQKNTSSQETTIPSWLRPSVEPLYKQSASIAQQIASQPYQRYGGQRVADINPGMRTAITGIQGNVNNPMLNASKGYTSDVLSGKYMQGNPYLQDVINKSTKDITSSFQKSALPQMQSNLARQGAFGGSGWSQANRDINEGFAESLADTISNLRYQDYGQERGYMDQSSGRAADLSQIDLGNLQAALSASDIDRQRQQQQMDVDYGDFTEQRDWLFRALQGLQGGLGNVEGLYGKTGTTSGSGGGNLLGSLGQLAGGAGMFMSGMK